MHKIDELLNHITMYRLLVYGLAGLAALSIVFAFVGTLSTSPTTLVVSLALLLTSAYLADRGFARLFKVPTNMESWLITSLILFLILQPATSVMTGIALLLAGALSSVSKFILTWNRRHIFNPAALAASVVSLTALQPVTWWVGSTVFWPFTMIFGLAVVRKIRRFPLVLTFVVTSVLLQLGLFVAHGQPLGIGMKGALVASPLIFLSTIMLTEPATMPPRRNQQLIFALLVAVLYVTGWKIGPIYIYPEVALLLGNLYAFAVMPKFRVRLRLLEIQRISASVYNYIFQPDERFNFAPGQYMEWTLPGVSYDSRGNRRTFTIASSPTEPVVQLGIKYYDPASAYKAVFGRLQIGDSVYASQLAGDFTFNPQADGKLAFVAGGIGVTPFRSMIKYLLDSNLQRDITVLYVVSDAAELAYDSIFREAAQRVGIRYIPIVTKPTGAPEGILQARLTEELLARLIPDYAERTFYISGPNSMVDASKRYVRNLGVARRHIKTDHFSGY